MKAILNILGLATASLTLAVAIFAPQSVESSSEKIHKANSLTATLSVQVLGGSLQEYKVQFSKPNLSIIESSETLKTSDGQSLFSLNKTANSYSKTQFSQEKLNDWLVQPELMGWASFFTLDLQKAFTVSPSGKAKKVRGIEVTAYSIAFKNIKDTAEIYVEKTTGIIRGYTLNKGDKTYIVWATKIALSEEPILAEIFAFKPPAGAVDSTIANAESATWNSVSKILNDNCLPCHGEAATDNLDVRSYETVISSGKVKSGDSASSPLVRAMKSTRKQMPPKPKAPLPADQIATIEAWINAGAKK